MERVVAKAGPDAARRAGAGRSGERGAVRQNSRRSSNAKKGSVFGCERNSLGGRSVKLGNLEFHIISAGTVLLDGGAMFGVVPRPLWSKKMPPDERNRIVLGLNCLLIETGGERILVETGVGDKMSAKLRDIYGFDGPYLTEGLRGYGVRPEDIDIVLNTHLHFDHCGGNTRIEKDKVVPGISERALRGPARRVRTRHESERARSGKLFSGKLRTDRIGWHVFPPGHGRYYRAGRGSPSRTGPHREHAVREAYRRREDRISAGRSCADGRASPASVDYGLRSLPHDDA